MSHQPRNKLRHLPKARSWLTYPYYIFERYPDLQPDDHTARRAFNLTLDTYRERLIPIPGVLDGLSEPRVRLLSALVADCDCLVELWSQREKGIQLHREAIRKLHDTSKGIDKRKKRAVKELDNLEKYATGGNPFVAEGIREVVAQTRHALREASPPSASFLRRQLAHVESLPHPSPSDPFHEITQDLYSFFVDRCRLRANEGCVRVGKIGNTFWGWNVHIVEGSRGGHQEAKDCSAVRIRLGRLSTRRRLP